MIDELMGRSHDSTRFDEPGQVIKGDKYTILGTLQGIIDGTVHGTVVQDPFEYGYQAVKVLKALHEGDESVIPANKFIDIPAK